MSRLSGNISRRFSTPALLSPPVKRHPPGPETLFFARDEIFYFDDGNLVLVAENVAFRVHKGVLTRHSNYFRELLVQRHGPDMLNTTDVFDGCPVIRLPNRTYQISELLRILYDHIKIFLDDPWQLTELLRLSVQFQIKHVKNFALEALSEAYPTTLSSYDAYRGSRPKCGDVIKLAHEIGVQNVLPCAYYEICRYPMRIISTLGFSEHVLENICQGRGHLASRLAIFIDSKIPDSEIVTECKLPLRCADEWRYLKEEAQRMLSKPGSMTGLLPLSMVGSLVDFPYVDAMCSICRGQFRDSVRAERDEIWASLPDIFNLGSWESLLDHGL